MRAVVQRVTEASVSVAGEPVAAIGPGLLVLVGISPTDELRTAAQLAGKIAGLRILRDGGRDESSAPELGAPVLVVSQFTLYGDTGRGRRPSWQLAAPASVAEPLIKAVVDELAKLGLAVQTGCFGASMAVASINDGPFTLVIEL